MLMVFIFILMPQIVICALVIYGLLMDVHDVHPLRKLTEWRHTRQHTPSH
jgi:hypothetical protein